MRPTVAFTTFSTVLRASFSIIFDVLNATKTAMARKSVAVTVTTATLILSTERAFNRAGFAFVNIVYTSSSMLTIPSAAKGYTTPVNGR